LIVPPHILWTRSLYEGWTTLRLVRLWLESGDVVDREVEDHGNAVAVLPFDPVRRTALLVRILRPRPSSAPDARSSWSARRV
jgi:hypothetical protein